MPFRSTQVSQTHSEQPDSNWLTGTFFLDQEPLASATPIRCRTSTPIPVWTALFSLTFKKASQNRCSGWEKNSCSSRLTGATCLQEEGCQRAEAATSRKRPTAGCFISSWTVNGGFKQGSQLQPHVCREDQSQPRLHFFPH